MRARHPFNMPEGADLELESRSQLQLCSFTARWDPWFALYWWWTFLTAPLTWALASHGRKVARLAEREALAGRLTLLGYLGAAAQLDAHVRLVEFVQSLPVRLERRFEA